MENYKSESSPFSVPIPLRRAVFHVCRLKPIGDVARGLYCVSSHLIGRSLMELPEMKAVYLMGGSAHRIIPAMSDLDLLLFTKLDSESILKLRQKCLHLKKIFWIPGEIIPLDDATLYYLENSGCSLSIHLFGKTQKLSGDSIHLKPTKPPDPKNLFMLLMRFYWKAKSSVSRNDRKTSHFEELDCRRYLSKIIALDEGTRVTSYLPDRDSMSLASLFSEASMVLDKRAKENLQDLFPKGVQKEIIQYFDAQKNALNPMSLTRDAAICRLLGLTLESWSQVLKSLQPLPQELFIQVLNHATRERAMRRYFQLPGDMMLNSHEAIRSKLNQFCRLGSYLVTQEYFAERDALARYAETTLPITASVLRKTHQESSKLSIKEMVECTMAVRQELEKVIFS